MPDPDEEKRQTARRARERANTTRGYDEAQPDPVVEYMKLHRGQLGETANLDH